MGEVELRLEEIIAEVHRQAERDGKPTGFCIGNTRKVDREGMYFSPIRNTSRVVAGSVIVYSVDQARRVAEFIDGKVDFVLVDTEKKISTELYTSDNVGNVERAVRESIRQSKILTFKGNDLTVDAIENLIVELLADYPRGLSGKKAGIVGAGNIGSKLALKLVERGVDVFLFRRDSAKLQAIVDALNIIKPKETIACAHAATTPDESAVAADLLVGLTHGTPVITSTMVEQLKPGAVIIDGGKGCVFPEAIEAAMARDIPIYRADIRPAFEGHVAAVFETSRILAECVGRAVFNGTPVVAGGLLAKRGEIVVDSITDPQAVYGMANGYGDFVRQPDQQQQQMIDAVRDYVARKGI